MQRWEVKLRNSPLLVQLAFVSKLHGFEHGTSHTDHEFGHLECLGRRSLSVKRVALGVDLLGYTVKVTEDYPSLRETEHSVKRTIWSFQH